MKSPQQCRRELPTSLVCLFIKTTWTLSRFGYTGFSFYTPHKELKMLKKRGSLSSVLRHSLHKIYQSKKMRFGRPPRAVDPQSTASVSSMLFTKQVKRLHGLSINFNYPWSSLIVMRRLWMSLSPKFLLFPIRIPFQLNISQKLLILLC